MFERNPGALAVAEVVIVVFHRGTEMKLVNVLFGLCLFAFAPSVIAGTVHSCKTSYSQIKHQQTIKKVTRCLLKDTDGDVGNIVEIKNQYNYTVATGKIIKRQRNYTVIVLREVFRKVRSGFPVIVKNNDSIDHWTATTAPF
ncbi:MAG: hypothetical protein AB7T49_02735 [Oligoflexales bacterium]